MILKKINCHSAFLFFLFFSFFSFSQKHPKIRAKRESGLIFFQKGAKSDTLVKNKSDLFYVYVPDSLRKNYSILTENGQLQPAQADSVFKFTYLYGLKYESLFIKVAYNYQTALRTLINGTSAIESNKIRIQVFDKKEEKVILENVFFYRPD